MQAAIKCPVTGREFQIDLPVTADDMARYWRSGIVAKCPHCGKEHTEAFKQLYTSSVFGTDGTEVAKPHVNKRRVVAARRPS
jgi:hypothetical protein